MTKLIETPQYYLLGENSNLDDSLYWVYDNPNIPFDGIITKTTLPYGWFDKLHDKEFYFSVIAHLPKLNHPALEGVERLKEIGEDVERLADEYIEKTWAGIPMIDRSDIERKQSARYNYIESVRHYKAASAKKFSEEQMLQMAGYAFAVGKDRNVISESEGKNLCYSFLQSLTTPTDFILGTGETIQEQIKSGSWKW